MKTDLNNDFQPEGDQLAKQPDRRDRQLLQDARGLQPRQARSQRQQNLNPRAADLCGELNFAPRPHIAYYHQQQKFNLLSKPNAMLVLVGICSVIMAVFTFPNIWRLC